LEIGIYTRETGDVRTAVSHLGRVEQEMFEAGLDVSDSLHLRVRRHLAIAQRLAGEPRPEPMETILEAYEDLFGPSHPQSVSTRLSVAAEAHERGDYRRAVELAGTAVQHYEDSLGPGHPFTEAARMNLALYLRSADRQQEASGLVHRAVAALESALSEAHPWAITARLAVLFVDARPGEREAAFAMADYVYDLSREYLPDGHLAMEIANEWRRDLRNGSSGADPIAERSSHRCLDITIPET
jgi:hypothetical protein